MRNVLQFDIENSSGQKVWQEVEFVFGKLIAEALLLQFIASVIYTCEWVLTSNLRIYKDAFC